MVGLHHPSGHFLRKILDTCRSRSSTIRIMMIKKEEFCHPRDESKTVCSDQSIHGANVNGDDIDDKNYDDEEFMCVCVCV